MISFIKSNFSDVISILGIALTIFFSFGASRSAKAARTASETTRIHLKKVEITAALQECLYMAQSLLPKVDNEEWDGIGRISSDIRLRLISIRHSSGNLLEEERIELIENSIFEFSIITNRCDRFRLGGGGLKPSKPRMLASIHLHMGNLAIVQESAKGRLRETNATNH